MALWFLYGVSRDRNPVVLSRQVLTEFGVTPRSASRGLAALEDAGLVTVVRCHGRLPRVTILEVTDVALVLDR
jgi:DNA-binding transcriptional ArsR family regulator